MDASLMERLQLFHESGQIDQDIFKKVPKLLETIEEKFAITLEEENAGQFVTHLSIALQRIKTGQTVKEPPAELKPLAEQNSELYSFAKEILQTETEEAELLFITLYLCTLTGKGE
jgi:transcriptional regulatory protein LevR